MVIKDLEAKSKLVARARKKAERNGTTLESEVENWLLRYVSEPHVDDELERQAANSSQTRQSAPPAIVKRARESTSKAPPVHTGRDTRSAAYRRLLGVMSDSSKRTT
ncbi:MAG: hypothetical protein AB8B64_16265 [Granulosicoccus sp.]